VQREPDAAPEISLRPARLDDFDFAFGLYLDSTRPLLLALGRWDEDRVRARFVDDFKPHCAHVICAAGAEIGWMQVSRIADGFHLDQLHLADGHRDHGIGTQLIEALLARARAAGCCVALNVIRGNPARHLYERLGFRFVGEDDDKLKMLWDGA
jgi:ribosomal protein S18 acetylase RimI-like enzyme